VPPGKERKGKDRKRTGKFGQLVGEVREGGKGREGKMRLRRIGGSGDRASKTVLAKGGKKGDDGWTVRHGDERRRSHALGNPRNRRGEDGTKVERNKQEAIQVRVATLQKTKENKTTLQAQTGEWVPTN